MTITRESVGMESNIDNNVATTRRSWSLWDDEPESLFGQSESISSMKITLMSLENKNEDNFKQWNNNKHNHRMNDVNLKRKYT